MSNQNQPQDTASTPVREPEQYPRRVLIAAIGMSPQILTETLYCIAVDTVTPFVPTEVHLLTTAKGKNIVEAECLDRENGKLSAFLRDYNLPLDVLGNIKVHVVSSADGKPLNDIVTPVDNEQYANMTSRLLAKVCADPDSAVHVSLAGGCKTMVLPRLRPVAVWA